MPYCSRSTNWQYMGRCTLIYEIINRLRYIVYKCCAAAETELDFGDDVIVVTSKFSDAYKCVQRDIDKIKREFPFYEEMILFFTSPNNFRKKILPEYKGHRNRKKPCGFKRVINQLKKDYKVIVKDTL